MNKILIALASAGATALMAAGPVQAAQLSGQAQTFMKTAARTNLAEIQEGQFMEQKAASPQVRQLAQMMVHDHTQMNQQLEQAAQQDGVQLPTQPNHKQRKQLQSLEKMSGNRLDQAYVRDQVKDHQKAIQQFQNAEQSVNNPQVKQLAAQGLPVLQKHLEMAQQAEGAMGQGGKAG